jgi:CHAT domain
MSTKIESLARRIQGNQEIRQRPFFTLMLGSDVMPHRQIEDLVLQVAGGKTPNEIAAMDPFTREDLFAKNWEQVQTERSAGEYFRSIFNPQNNLPGSDGYECLAYLIEKGFFSLILTADISNRLENALIQRKLPMDRWRVHSCLKDDPQDIYDLIATSGASVHIIKIYGDFSSMKFAFSASEIADATNRATEVLERYLADSTFLVDYNPNRDNWPFPKTSKMPFYYAASNFPRNGALSDVLRTRSEELNRFISTEISFDEIFSQLRKYLGDSLPTEVSVSDKEVAPVGNSKEDGPLVLVDDSEETPPGTTPLSEHLSPLSELLVEQKVSKLIIRYENNRVTFRVEGQLNFDGSSINLDANMSEYNDTMTYLGENIASHYNSNNDAGRINWRSQTKRLGKDIFESFFGGNTDLIAQYSAAQQVSGDENLFLGLSGSRDSLKIPFELLQQSNNTLAMSLKHPVYRQITGINRNLQNLDSLIRELREEDEPLRILYIASGIGGGISPDEEIESISIATREKLQRLEIPHEIDLYPTARASYDDIRDLLERCSYHIVHYAGHGYHEPGNGEQSGLFFWSEREGKGEPRRLTATQLSTLLRSPRTKTRIFFLNCCVGAMVNDQQSLRSQDYLGLMEAVVQSGVPVVLGYRWYVRDGRARRFAEIFYRTLFGTRSPGLAVLDARKALHMDDADDETWMSTILVDQTL